MLRYCWFFLLFAVIANAKYSYSDKCYPFAKEDPTFGYCVIFQ